MNHRGLLVLFLTLSCGSLSGCAIIGAQIGGAIGRSIGEKIREEPPIDKQSTVDVNRGAFAFTFPGNWKMDVKAESFDPDHHLVVRTYKQRGFELLTIYDSVLDPAIVARTNLEMHREKTMPGATVTVFGTWGGFHGAGATLTGTDIDGRSSKMRIFSFVAAGRTYAVVEFAPMGDRKKVNEGFGMIESSFRVAGFNAAPAVASVREGNVEARKLYLAGQYPSAVTLLLAVQATCRKACDRADRSAAWMLLGTIQARHSRDAATKTFLELLKTDPAATLEPTLATPQASAAFAAAQAQVPPVRAISGEVAAESPAAPPAPPSPIPPTAAK